MSIRTLAVATILSAIALAGCAPSVSTNGTAAANATTTTTEATPTNATNTTSNVGRSDAGKPVSGPAVGASGGAGQP